MLKIAITGPESTGKTTLTRQLAAHYRTLWVPEYARFYLMQLDRPYTHQDVITIAKGQAQWEDELRPLSNHLLFCDTDLIVAKIWLQFKYNLVNEWIETQVRSRHYDLHLLCDIDLPWSPDPLREHPELRDRQELLQLYKTTLTSLGANFVLINGNEQERLTQAILLVEHLQASLKQ
ncbi:MAG TPA: ATP-binding protein [Saprospiraceae bacterium]|nr:ATP-binding protein [Saprospiraceae bacterium]HMP25019.1 ATP-binding protein [Saprospiraceae bacterium]